MKRFFYRSRSGNNPGANGDTGAAVYLARLRNGFILLSVVTIFLFSGLMVHSVAETHRERQITESKADGFTLERLRAQVQNEGLTGTIHGAVHGTQTYVFTVRNPENFFDNYEFSLVPGDTGVFDTLQTLNRHDLVTIWGEFLPNPTPQGHVMVRRIEVKERWTGHMMDEPTAPAYNAAPLPQSLTHRHQLTGIVHAVSGDGAVLVMDYQNVIVPVVVPDKRLARALWRGDKVTLYFKPMDSHLPTHLVLDLAPDDGASPLQVVERLQKLDGQFVTLEGSLALFPKSPLINRDVWALEQQHPDGSRRYFTLFNFEDAADQARLEQKLRQWWEQSAGFVVRGRNNLVNPQLRVRVSGEVNVETPNQANPQIKTRFAQVERVKP